MGLRESTLGVVIYGAWHCSVLGIVPCSVVRCSVLGARCSVQTHARVQWVEPVAAAAHVPPSFAHASVLQEPSTSRTARPRAHPAEGSRGAA